MRMRPFGVGGGICIEAIGEEAVHLLYAAFVAALFLHHLVQQRDVERHDGNGGARLGHHGLVDGDVGAAALSLQIFVESLGRLFQMIFGVADGPVAIDRVGNFRADVGISDRANAVGEHARFVERFDPHLPVFPAHDCDGVGDLFLVRRVDGDVGNFAGLDVDGLVGVGAAEGLEDGAEVFASARVRTPRRS